VSRKSNRLSHRGGTGEREWPKREGKERDFDVGKGDFRRVLHNFSAVAEKLRDGAGEYDASDGGIC
jgi:hypothetical protein